MSFRIDLTDRKFGSLTVISFFSVHNTHARWNVICDCGKELIVDSGNLLNGNTKSCGICSKTTHGMSETSFYKKWSTLKSKSEDVSKEWHIFENFKDDTYCTFTKGCRLYRIDRSKKFSKENCYWSVPNYSNTIQNEKIFFIDTKAKKVENEIIYTKK